MGARHYRRSPSGHVDPFYKRRRRFQAALEPLGLWESFKRMPRYIQEQFWRAKLPDPTLEFDPSVPPVIDCDRIREAAELEFREDSLIVDHGCISPADFVGVITACRLMVRGTPAEGMPKSVGEFLRTAGPTLEHCHEQQNPKAMLALYNAVYAPLLKHSRIDRHTLLVTFKCEPGETNKPAVKLIISSVASQSKRLSVQGAWRNVYRVPMPQRDAPLRWVSWGPSHLGHADHDQHEYPVYVQSHALVRLRQRVTLSAAAPYLESWLSDSLAKPRIVERLGRGPESDLRVEYRITGKRLGYLIVRPLQNMMVVRTFEFLTMAHTPEGRKLSSRLRLMGSELDHWKLSTLDAFTRTDLRDDQKLRPIMEACGLGHLFELDNIGDCMPREMGFSDKLKHYLRMAA